MNSTVSAATTLVDLDEIGVQAQRARNVLGKVRGHMLSPQASKVEPLFSVNQLGALCGLDARQVDYRVRKGGVLPSGTLNAAGTRREFKASEVCQWSREFRAANMRPDNLPAMVVTLANFKGGVSKTTTAMTLAQGLSVRGHRVLAIDCDPQGSLTTLFGILPDSEVEAEQTILPLCLGNESTVDYAVRPTYWSGIDLIPSQAVMFSAEFALPSRQKDEGEGFQFWNVLNYGLDSVRERYDVIVIDTSPSLSYLTINAMMAADGIVTPLPPNSLDFASSVQFWNLFHDVTQQLHRYGKNKKTFEFVDVLLAKVDGADVATSVVREWIGTAYGAKVLPVEIPKTSTAASSSLEFGSIYDLKRGSASNQTIKRAMDAYERFVEHVEQQCVGAWRRQLAALGGGAS